jgi:hypothetical protein
LIYTDPESPEDAIQEKSFSLSDDVQTGISGSVEDLPFEIAWVDEYSDFQFEEVSEYDEEDIVLILFGNLNPLKVDFLQVFVTTYYADQTYQSYKVNLDSRSGSWEVISVEKINS